MKCTWCNGTGKAVGLFPKWGDEVPPEKRKPYVEMDCFECNGTGEAPESPRYMPEWIKKAKILRELIKTKSPMTVRQLAIHLEIDLNEFSHAASGKIDPSDVLFRVRAHIAELDRVASKVKGAV